jgi:hypothetical protein
MGPEEGGLRLRLPDFIGIGAPRSGTRWLAQCLAEHPEISLPSDEVYFFTQSRIVHSFWNRGVEWYSGILERSMSPGTRICGEVTPTYLLDHESAELIHQVVPNVKLIALLRDQCERAYSWYRFFLKLNPDLYETNYTFRRFLTYHTEVFNKEGFYLDHLARFLARFPRESLLVLLYDDISQDPRTLVRRIYEFLGVDPTFVPPSAVKTINRADVTVQRSRVIERAADVLAKFRGGGWMSKLLQQLNSVSLQRRQLPLRHGLDPEMRQRMYELYVEHNRRLGEFLGRDLSHWNTERGESDESEYR